MQGCIAIGISLPKDILSRIDSDRGDVSRSKYLLRMLEKTYLIGEDKKEGKGHFTRRTGSQDSLDRRLDSLPSSESNST